MSYEQIVIYGTILIIAIKIFLFFRGIYKNLVRTFHLGESEKKTDQVENHDIQVYKENLKVVDIVKPVGKWTKMVILNDGLMQRLVQLIAEEGDEKGYWELFVKAQASTQGKYKGRRR
ncbi:hypothetical protein [Wolbachia endosymbiont (group A) of Rhinocyllus conicus]|uniref:hypothetical protein n=1 Tax=Wolbachia endosymbiont (group A) of Rhinocyllus conicus TaxID=2954053 RepID=UPI0022275AF9|nr:hypothetical protein [Wolbachia endosymbiont (group A) of Rhinocyllus conicus]